MYTFRINTDNMFENYLALSPNNYDVYCFKRP